MQCCTSANFHTTVFINESKAQDLKCILSKLYVMTYTVSIEPFEFTNLISKTLYVIFGANMLESLGSYAGYFRKKEKKNAYSLKKLFRFSMAEKI